MKAKMVKKVVSALMAAVLTAGLLTGCGSGKAAGTDSQAGSDSGGEKAKDPVTLEWYYAGNGIQADTQKVEDYVNELLKDYKGLEHVSVKMNCILANDYPQQVLLAQTSGKKMDIIQTYRLDYVTEIRNGTFLPIDDYLNSDEFAALKNELPQWLWQSLKVDGATYIVPNYQIGATDRYIFIPKDYLQYADVEKLKKLKLTDSASIIELSDEIANITRAVNAAEGTNKYAYPSGESIATAFTYFHQDVIDRNSGFIMRDGEKIKNLYLDDAFKEASRIAAEWVEEGLLPSDAAVQDRQAWEGKNLLNDNAYAVMVAQAYGTEEQVSAQKSSDWGIEVEAIRLHDHYFMINGWGAGGNGVAAASEHPEEALKFIEALNTEKGKDIYNAVVYGLEGIHYEKVDDTHIKTLEYEGTQGLSDSSYAAWKWVIGNTKYAYLNQGCIEGDMEIVASINEDPENVISQMMGFRVNMDPVATEVSQCAAVVAEYRDALMWGSLGAGWETYYDEFAAKMEAAGVQKAIDEFQKQYDTWKAEQ